MLHWLKIPYKRSQLDFKRTRVCPRGNSRGNVVPFQRGLGGVLSDTPWLTSTRAPVRGSSGKLRQQDVALENQFQSGGGLCVCLFSFRTSDPAAIGMVVPVGLVMTLKPPEEYWYIRADKQGRWQRWEAFTIWLHRLVVLHRRASVSLKALNMLPSVRQAKLE